MPSVTSSSPRWSSAHTPWSASPASRGPACWRCWGRTTSRWHGRRGWRGGLSFCGTPRPRGLAERTVMLRHALKNALLPIITVIGIYYGGLLEGAVLTETVFAWPGLGRYATNAMLSQDFAGFMGVTLLIALIFSFANLIVDLAYGLLNPKIRYE